MNLIEIICELDGTPFQVNNQSITFRDAILEILQSPTQGNGDQKYEYYSLAMRTQKENNITFSPSERKILRKRVGEVAIPLILGRIWDALDEDEAKERASKK